MWAPSLNSPFLIRPPSRWRLDVISDFTCGLVVSISVFDTKSCCKDTAAQKFKQHLGGRGDFVPTLMLIIRNAHRRNSFNQPIGHVIILPRRKRRVDEIKSVSQFQIDLIIRTVLIIFRKLGLGMIAPHTLRRSAWGMPLMSMYNFHCPSSSAGCRSVAAWEIAMTYFHFWKARQIL